MSEIKSFSFPTVSPHSMDFEECEYSVKINRSKDGAEITVAHSFIGEGLISQLLEEGSASFACVVSIKSTMYRKIYVAEYNGSTTMQQINYKKSGYGQNESAVESPMFRPIILANDDIRTKAEEKHNLTKLWQGVNIYFPKGSIIAYCSWERFGGAEGGLLTIAKDENLHDGQLYVKDITEGGFRFKVYVSNNIFGKIQQTMKTHTGQTNSILTHALSEAFRILNIDHKNDWDEHINLRLLADQLKQAEVLHWSEEDFDPAVAATAINPHAYPVEEKEDDDN